MSDSVSGFLILCWILLLAGRWVVGTALLALRVVSADTMARWDAGILLRAYLMLVVATLVVLALRAARSLEARHGGTGKRGHGTDPQ